MLKYLSLNPNIKIKQLILVAPWLDPEHTTSDFLYDTKLDPTLAGRVGRIDLFVSSDDEQSVLDSTKEIHKTYPNIKMHEFTDKGHFCEKALQFPELLEVITCTQ